MKKAMKTRIASVVLALVMIAALSATAFADGPQGGPQMGNFQQDRQMGDPQQDSFRQDRQMGDPQQGGFGQNQQSPEIPEGDEGRAAPSDGENRQREPMKGQLPLEDPNDADDMTPPEKPEGENPSLPQNEQDMFRLFQQFLEWLKSNNAA